MSENEINNITVDFNGTPTYFHNQSNNEIYVKQFDIRTGLTTTQKFIKPEHAEHELSHDKPSESIKTCQEDIQGLKDRITVLEQTLEETQAKGGKK